eukprot:1184209-Prorocentrum_minimum.AAC.1
MPAAGANRVRRGGICHQPGPIARGEGVYDSSRSQSREERGYMPAAGANRVRRGVSAAAPSHIARLRRSPYYPKRGPGRGSLCDCPQEGRPGKMRTPLRDARRANWPPRPGPYRPYHRPSDKNIPPLLRTTTEEGHNTQRRGQ